MNISSKLQFFVGCVVEWMFKRDGCLMTLMCGEGVRRLILEQEVLLLCEGNVEGCDATGVEKSGRR